MTPEEIEVDLQEQAESGITEPAIHADNAGDIFDGLRLHCSRWTGNLANATFIRCDLRGATFDPERVDLSGATFYLCRLANATIPDTANVVNCELIDMFAVPEPKEGDSKARHLAAMLCATMMAVGICFRQAQLVRSMIEGAAAGALFAAFLAVVQFWRR